MSKRKLSRQQRDRIDQRQAQKVRDAANNSDSPGNDQRDTTAEFPGLVICHYGQQLDVEALSGKHQGQLIRCHQRANLPPLVSGDRVIWQAEGEATGVVVALTERRNVFSRPGFGGELKPVAANIDWLIIVLAPIPRAHRNLLDRYLVAAETLGLRPVLLFNKSDLQAGNLAELDNIMSFYQSLGYAAERVSALQGSGIEALRARLSGSTAVIVGQSGVGKSSLINALSPNLAAQVGALSEAGPKGTHTTTTVRLFHGETCDLIDSPGIREFNLWHISAEQLLAGFIEFRPWIGRCRFRDCQHRQEPHCALQQAVLDGHISAERMNSYQQIRNSLNSEGGA